MKAIWGNRGSHKEIAVVIAYKSVYRGVIGGVSLREGDETVSSKRNASADLDC